MSPLLSNFQKGGTEMVPYKRLKTKIHYIHKITGMSMNSARNLIAVLYKCYGIGFTVCRGPAAAGKLDRNKIYIIPIPSEKEHEFKIRMIEKGYNMYAQY